MLSQAEIESFTADGYVAVRGAVPADVLRLCQDEIWSALGEHDVRRDDPSTWREPVVRISCPESEAFAAAGSQPVLWEAFDQLIGEGRWWRRRGVGGSIPVRFPSQADPGDAGWHIEGSFEVGGDWWVNYRSRARGLLALYHDVLAQPGYPMPRKTRCHHPRVSSCCQLNCRGRLVFQPCMHRPESPIRQSPGQSPRQCRQCLAAGMGRSSGRNPFSLSLLGPRCGAVRRFGRRL